MNIGFVPAKANDAAAVSALRQRIWDTTYRGIYPDAVIDDFNYDWHQQRDLKKISDPSFTVYLIRYGNENIGYFVFQHTGSGDGCIRCMCCRNISTKGLENRPFPS